MKALTSRQRDEISRISKFGSVLRVRTGGRTYWFADNYVIPDFSGLLIRRLEEAGMISIRPKSRRRLSQSHVVALTDAGKAAVIEIAMLPPKRARLDGEPKARS